ncbi:hypothetical protein KIPB_012587, partial [Kipferlia bialata]|eukprot:g12587.t1
MSSIRLALEGFSPSAALAAFSAVPSYIYAIYAGTLVLAVSLALLRRKRNSGRSRVKVCINTITTFQPELCRAEQEYVQ